MVDLKPHLDALVAATDAAARLAADPVAFPHRYTSAADQEVAGLLAAGLAYGRVAAFRPIIAALCEHADAYGGPAAWVRTVDLERDAPLANLGYRWMRGPDFVWWAATLHRAYSQVDSLEQWFDAAGERDIRAPLSGLVQRLRGCALEVGPSLGQRGNWRQATRGIRYLLPDPADGSACKRWCMWLRWMVRPSTEGIDLDLWHSVGPDQLVIPVDTHVLRVSQFLGLTARRDGSWRTAREITDRLAELDPGDPTRYDFALAHLGISGACLGHRSPACPTCALDTVCTAPQGAA